MNNTIMTKDMVLLAWGEPYDINIIDKGPGKYEQLVNNDTDG